MPASSKPVFTIPVRELVEFVLRRGDLGGEREFTGSDRALAGTRGHQKIQRSRPAGYQKEVAAVHELETDDFTLRIQGRIDGILTGSDGVVLEEIKTVQGSWNREPDPLHWAQAHIYGFILARKLALETLTLQLTYLDLRSNEITEFRESRSLADLTVFFDEVAGFYLGWIRELHAWRQLRDTSLQALAFPFAAYRPGQRQLAVAAYRTFERGGRLFAEAPTGIGKTISVLFPALKALAGGKLELLFYLTARTVGRVVAEDALTGLRASGMRLRSVTLTAREKLCVRNGQPCEVMTCPLALGYYDRRHAAIRAALERESITRPVLESVGQEHQVCPFELSLDVSDWAEAVICDYNYVFDPQVYLRRHFGDKPGAYGFLIDEAHNLVDRAREMFSGELEGEELASTRQAIKSALPACARRIGKLGAVLRKLAEPARETDGETSLPEVASERDLFISAVSNEPLASDDTTPGPIAIREYRPGVRLSRVLPPELAPLIDDALREAEAWLARNEPADFREQLLQLYFRLHSFRKVCEAYDERYVTIVEAVGRGRLRLFCLDPSHRLRQALDRGHAAVFFSATLTPADYFCELLGGEVGDARLCLASPFAPEHLTILAHTRLRVDLKARSGTLPEVARAIGALVAGRAGNYLVYLSSYQYLSEVRAAFEAAFPETRVIAQQPGMSESERGGFLGSFTTDNAGGTLVGFAVLGGIFGEGIDLVGERLIGVAIVGVGLPQLCVERDLIRDYFQAKTGRGFDYAYTFPGMNRVVQAIGRVIRSESDRGAALLIDARFAERRYRELFPVWWCLEKVTREGDIAEALDRFWPGQGGD